MRESNGNGSGGGASRGPAPRPYLMDVPLERDGEGTVEAEVDDLERPGPTVHEQVMWLEVIVQHPAAMNEGGAMQNQRNAKIQI
jgi:hypothetical protein